MTLNRKKDQVKHLIFKSILLWKYVQGAHISHPSGHDLPTTSRKSNSRNKVFYYVSNRYHNVLYAPRHVGRNVKECWKLTILVCCSSAHNVLVVLVLGVLKLCTARRVQLLFGGTFLAPTVKSFNLSQILDLTTKVFVKSCCSRFSIKFWSWNVLNPLCLWCLRPFASDIKHSRYLQGGRSVEGVALQIHVADKQLTCHLRKPGDWGD